MSKTLVFNWKMNPSSLSEANNLATIVMENSTEIKNSSLNSNFVICPSFVHLSAISNYANFFELGCQDISTEIKGAFTGQISGNQLADLGVKYVLIGHSETRDKTSYQEINQKMLQAQNHNLTPILCVGYEKTPSQKDEITINFTEIKEQIETALENVNVPVWVAYEPVWAIGTGKIADNQIIQKVLDFCRVVLEQKNNLPNKFLYGGSVSPENILELGTIDGIDGFLIGGASLIPTKLIEILNSQN